MGNRSIYIRIVRFLIVVSLMLYLMFFFAPYYQSIFYDDDLIGVISAFPAKNIIEIPDFIFWLFLFSHVFVSGFLYFRLMYSRELYLFYFAVSVFAYFATGINVYTGFDMVLVSFFNFLDGMILFAVFNIEWKKEAKTTGFEEGVS